MERKKKVTFVPASCSCMTLTSKEGRHYWFRTCDIEKDLWKEGAHGVQYAAGSRIEYDGEKTETCLYSFMGMTYNVLDTWLLDGVNEFGLTGGLLMLYEGTSVEKAEEGKMGYVGMELVTKFLSSCKDVKEVKSLAGQIQVLNIPVKEGSIPATMHYFFTDLTGDEVILEASDQEKPGIFKVYKKEEILGVMTNSPTYPKQLENLSWFLSQSLEIKHSFGNLDEIQLELDTRSIRASQEAEHLSLNGTFPASYASYDRFIRLAVFKALNHSGNDFASEQMLALGSNLMNVVAEPRSQGVFHYNRIDREGVPQGQKDSYTQYLIMYDMEQKSFYIKPYDKVTWKKCEIQEWKKGEKITVWI